MLRPESNWQDEQWLYDYWQDDPDSGSYKLTEEELNVTPKFVAKDEPPYTPSDIGWWAALALVAVGGALTIVAAAFLCQVIGL